MRKVFLGTAIATAALAVVVSAAGAQVSTRNQSSGPFSSDWARPPGQTGGYFYNDPRTQPQRSGTPSQQVQPGGVSTCPVGTAYSTATRRCQ